MTNKYSDKVSKVIYNEEELSTRFFLYSSEDHYKEGWQEACKEAAKVAEEADKEIADLKESLEVAYRTIQHLAAPCQTPSEVLQRKLKDVMKVK